MPQLPVSSESAQIVGRSPELLDLLSKVRRIGPLFQVALIAGETGTGKELVALALHRASQSPGILMTCNCGALVETLFESELFGYQKGAFTGAAQDKLGLIECAHGGTLFLDEVGELSLGMQAKLLRFLQTREVRRVGSTEVRTVEMRVIAATNRDLKEMMDEGRFRADLFFRLSTIELKLPRLADRMQDLTLLQNHFLDKYAKLYGTPRKYLTEEAKRALGAYHWPGNVRELENTLSHGCMMSEGEWIDVHHLPAAIGKRAPGEIPPGDDTGLVSLERICKKHVSRVLDEVGGNRAQAARILGIGRTTLYRLMKTVA